MVTTNNTACAVALFQNLFIHFFRHLISPLFQTRSDLFTRKFFTARLKSDIKKLSLKKIFSGHFFRQKTAITANKNKLSSKKIQQLRGWKLKAYKFYVQPN